MPKQLTFSEQMSGTLIFLTTPQNNQLPIALENYAPTNNSNNRSHIVLNLNIVIDDLDRFEKDAHHSAEAHGSVKINSIKYKIETGIFNLFTNKTTTSALDVHKEMHYLLYLVDPNGNKFTFYGFKQITQGKRTNIWEETTTLYSTFWAEHHSLAKLKSTAIPMLAIGTLHLSFEEFMKQIMTFKTNGSTPTIHLKILIQFLHFFSGELWESYAPTIFNTSTNRWNEHLIPLHTLDGVTVKNKRVLTFQTDDGLNLSVTNLYNEPKKDVILMLHGLTTSSDMFIMPEHYNISQYLLDNNIDDLWIFDWRGSNHHIYNLEPHRYTIDDIIKYDIKAIIELIKEHRGGDVKIHVIAHCVGSLAFMCALAAGKTSNIASVISNCVSLTPKVHLWAYIKLMFAPNLIEYLLGYPYISPKLAYFPGPAFGRWIYHLLIHPFHHECNEPSCHTISFMWGAGKPAAYEHHNLSPITHSRLADLFGGTSLHYYRHIFKMIRNKSAIPYQKDEELPKNYLQNTTRVKLPPIFLVEGANNHVFPHSNQETYKQLCSLIPEANIDYHEFANYGHQDIFIGKNCASEIFPTLLNFLQKHIRY